jgi:dihydrofolate reductase
MPKYVVSSTLEDPEWSNSTVLKGDVAEEVANVRERASGDVLVNGSAQLVRDLRKHDLVDEYRLMVFPIVLGGGKRLFADDGETSDLRLTASKPVGSDGVIILTYEPVRA